MQKLNQMSSRSQDEEEDGGVPGNFAAQRIF